MVGTKTILVVDDEVEIVELLTLLLDGDGRTILGAYDGNAALEIVREQRPDLVISDVMMPGIDGLELCRIIQSDPGFGEISIVLMSAINKLDLRECREDVFISKPFDIFTIEQTVERLLAGLA
ncbi:MAG: response regulator [Chloroflexota bacterium]|nr:response regulator [Chloroflexota bacterium]